MWRLRFRVIRPVDFKIPQRELRRVGISGYPTPQIDTQISIFDFSYSLSLSRGQLPDWGLNVSSGGGQLGATNGAHPASGGATVRIYNGLAGEFQMY